jgi:hypothetical protein
VLLGLTAPVQVSGLPPRAGEEEAKAFYEALGGRLVLAETINGKVIVDDFNIRGVVVAVDLIGTKVTAADLRHLQAFPHLETLDLSLTKVSGPELAALQPLAHLRELHLVGTPVTDRDLASLPKLPALETLWLHNTAVTDAGLVHLRRLPRLRELHLGSTKI